MAIKRIPKYKNIPFETGKTYTTKFATGEKFFLTRIIFNGIGVCIRFEGIFEKCPQLGECPLGPDRLISEKVEDGFIDICDNCGEPIN